MSPEQKGKTGATISKLWDLSRITRPRATREQLGIVPRTPTTLHLMFQPNFLADLYGDNQLVLQGFLSRVLPVWPASNMGNRAYRDPSDEDLQTVERFSARVCSSGCCGMSAPVRMSRASGSSNMVR